MALKPDSYVVLNDGNKMPVIGFGTGTDTAKLTPWNMPVRAPRSPLTLDIPPHRLRLFLYGNEVQIGQAIRIKDCGWDCEEGRHFFTLGSFGAITHTPERVQLGLEKSLKDLQLDYMDLFLIHHPVEFKPGDDPFPTDENGKAMEACRDAGLVRSIGVSNFNHRNWS
ncbi:unnamed protein product [Ranitomeya imitator]|uniref:NADP-dependent oxidoreductase domain-containing protein n=1 Tax=Ranitomeya imitator TaxID=111125 RepID=A0ABN9MAX0_9NEOB|nr:unnamed protein product [Ranitomeya imitator]